MAWLVFAKAKASGRPTTEVGEIVSAVGLVRSSPALARVCSKVNELRERVPSAQNSAAHVLENE